MKSVDFLILGGGWTGLLVAKELASKFQSASIAVLEASSENNLGGLLKSEYIKGFTFDTGGPHILFSKNKEILSKISDILGKNIRQFERKAVVYYENKYVPYPFENGIYTLEPKKRAQIGFGIIKSMIEYSQNPSWKPPTFKDWIYGFFGKEMGSSYLEPYNRKIWKTDPGEMDASWVFSPGRLPFPVLEDIILSIAGIESVGYKEQQFFLYPARGGIFGLYRGLFEKVKKANVDLIPNFTVSNIKKANGGWLINDEVFATKVISTLPLPILPNIMELPAEISRLCKQFIWNQDTVVGVSLNIPSPKEHVIYVPSPEINFHRITWMSNLAGAPKGLSNLIAETTAPYDEAVVIEDTIEKTITGLIRMGIIKSKDQVLFAKAWNNKFAYPIYKIGHVEARNRIFEYFNEIGFHSVGRWGSWHYWNTDKVLEAVLALTDELTKSGN